MFKVVINLELLGYRVNKGFFLQNHGDENRGENTMGPSSGPELEKLGPKYILALVEILDTHDKSTRNKTEL